MCSFTKEVLFKFYFARFSISIDRQSEEGVLLFLIDVCIHCGLYFQSKHHPTFAGSNARNAYYRNISILPSGILDFCKQKLWPLLQVNKLSGTMAIYISSIWNCVWCNPVSHAYDIAQHWIWCNPKNHDAIQWLMNINEHDLIMTSSSAAWCNPVSHEY